MSTNYGLVNQSKRQALVDLMRDMEWHSHAELSRVGGVRYGARLLEMKRLGFQIESESLKVQGKRYRMTSLVRGPIPEKKVKVYLRESDADEIVHGRLTATARDAVEDALGSFRTNAHKL